MSRVSRLSSSRVLTTLRLRRSWTSWRRSRTLARLERERRRLQLLDSLVQEQLHLLARLEQETGRALPELLRLPSPTPAQLQELERLRHPAKLIQLPQEPVQMQRLTPGTGRLQVPLTPEPPPPPPAKQQIAAELGLSL